MKTKSIIISHKELQENLFEAVTNGLSQINIGPGLQIVSDSTIDYFQWRIIESDKFTGCRMLENKNVYFHQVFKHEGFMNDIRTSFTVAMLNSEAKKFIENFKVYAAKEGIELYSQPVEQKGVAVKQAARPVYTTEQIDQFLSSLGISAAKDYFKATKKIEDLSIKDVDGITQFFNDVNKYRELLAQKEEGVTVVV